MSKVYLDNAASTPLLPEVIQRMHTILQHQHGNPSSIHSYGREAKGIIEDARKVVAHTLKASVGEIFFTSSATEANNTVLAKAIPHYDISCVITSKTEHPCVAETLVQLQKAYNFDLLYLDNDPQGNISLGQLEKLLDRSGKILVSLMHTNNEIGTIHDTQSIGNLCKQYDALYHCDAVQAIGKASIDVDADYYSFITSSAHKFHGPKAAGFFYMNSDNIIPPLLHGGAQERNMRAGTENVYGIAGLATALEFMDTHREEHQQTLQKLREYFIAHIVDIHPEIRILGNPDKNFAPHIVSVSFPPFEYADMLMFNLDIAGVAASSGSACSSGIAKTSPVLLAIDHPEDRVAIRFSFSIFNTTDEIDYVIETLKHLLP